jgi:hypothetical protein
MALLFPRPYSSTQCFARQASRDIAANLRPHSANAISNTFRYPKDFVSPIYFGSASLDYPRLVSKERADCFGIDTPQLCQFCRREIFFGDIRRSRVARARMTRGFPSLKPLGRTEVEYQLKQHRIVSPGAFRLSHVESHSTDRIEPMKRPGPGIRACARCGHGLTIHRMKSTEGGSPEPRVVIRDATVPTIRSKTAKVTFSLPKDVLSDTYQRPKLSHRTEC